MQYSDQRWQHPPQPRPAYSQPLVIFGPGAAPVLTLAGQNAFFCGLIYCDGMKEINNAIGLLTLGNGVLFLQGSYKPGSLCGTVHIMSSVEGG